MANKIYIADAYYDGRFGTQYGEVAQEPRQIKATSLPQAFKKAFGFLPSERVKPNTGYRYVNDQGQSNSATCYRVRPA